MTVHERVATARARLRAAGIRPESADLDARLLAQFALGWDAARFAIAGSDPEPPGFASRYETLVARRASREPLAYIVGRREFWGLEMEVSPAVLIPRPETELIIEEALRRFADDAELLVADVGTGSGCLAIALAVERPRWRVVATDVSHAALAVAQRNAVRHGVADRVTFANLDLLGTTTETFDLIVSNPPYVLAGDRPALQSEVRDHEPADALFAGHDGLAVIKRLVATSVGHLKRGGTLMFEFGFGQDEVVAQLVSQTAGLTLIECVNDLQEIPRVAVATAAGG